MIACDPLEPRLLMAADTVVVTDLLEPIRPLGSQAYEHTATGNLAVPTETDAFEIAVAGGQTLSVFVGPEAAGLDVAITIRDSGNAIVASTDTVGADGIELLQPVDLVAADTYSVEVTAIAGSGDYTVGLLLNGLYESESHGGADNDTSADAESLDAAMRTLASGGELAVVSGHLATPLEQPAVYANGFDVSTLGSEWSTYTVENGSVDILDGVLRTRTGGSGPAPHSLAEAVLTVDLSGLESAVLSFSHSEADGDVQPFSGPFQGHTFADGIAISEDGSNWLPLFDAPANPNADFHDYSLELAGISLDANTQIKFQHDGYYDSHRQAWDNIRITAPAEDWFEISLDAGDAITLGGVLAGSEISLDLFDSSGTIVASGSSVAGSLDTLIRSFTAGASGVYRLRVGSIGGGDYSLVVARNAEFDAERGDLPADVLTDLTRIGNAAGHLDVDLGRVFVYDQVLQVIVEIDPISGTQLGSFANPVLNDSGSPAFNVSLATNGTSILAAGYQATGLREIDPDTGLILRSIPASFGSATGIAYLNGEVFVQDETIGADVLVFDLATGALTRTLEVGDAMGSGRGLAALDGFLYATSINSLFRIDPYSGEVLDSINPPDFGTIDALGATKGELFVGVPTSGNDHVFVLDPMTWQTKRIFSGVAGGLTGIAGDGGDGVDRYTVSLNIGDGLQVTTRTPEHVGALDNPLDPVVDIYDPIGTLVVTDDNGADDGRNASLSHTATLTGLYTIAVRSVAGSGDYEVAVSGATGVAPSFTVNSIDPSAGALLGTAPATVTIGLSSDVDAATLDASDLTVDNLSATGFSVLDARTIRFDLPELLEGSHTIRVQADSMRSDSGLMLDGFVSSFELDVNAPTVIEASISEGEVVNPGPLALTFTFDRDLNSAGLDPGDVQLFGENVGGVTPQSFDYDPATRTLSLVYGNLAQDDYTLVLLSGDGRFEGADGANLDGETLAWPIGPNASGDGVEGGDFVVRFDVRQPIETAVSAFEPREVYGTLIYERVEQGEISSAGGTHTSVHEFESGQTISVSVTPELGFQPTVEIRDSGGTVVASASASTAGQTIILQTQPIATTGTYTVEVGGVGSSTGTFDLLQVLNAAIDPGAGNGTLATAQSIDSSELALTGGGSRLGAAGQFPQYLIVGDDFETGGFGAGWTTYGSHDSVDGMSGFWTNEVSDYQPAGGEGYALIQYHGQYVADLNGLPTTFGLNEATWTVNLAGQSDVYLQFDHADFGDLVDPLPASFNGHADGDGIAISNNGVNWYTIFTPGDQPDGVWTSHTIDVSAAAAAAGISVGSGFRIKFQQFGTGNPSNGGARGWDNIALTTAEEPAEIMRYYAFSLVAGETISLATVSEPGAVVHATLINASGEVLAVGQPGSENFDVSIENFTAPYTGDYYIRVDADPLMADNAKFSVAVVKNAGLSSELGSTIGPVGQVVPNAQHLDGPTRLIGSVGLEFATRLIGYDGVSRYLYEIDPETGVFTPLWSTDADVRGLATTPDSVIVSAYTGTANDATTERSLATGETIRSLFSEADETVFAGELYRRDGATLEVVGYESRSYERIVPLDSLAQTIRHFFATDDGLYGLNDELVYRVDRFTGESTFIGSLGATPLGTFDVRDVAVFGDDLYVINYVDEWPYNFHLQRFDWPTLAFDTTLYVAHSPTLPLSRIDVGGSLRDDDYYTFDAAIGDQLTLETGLPLDAMSEYINQLDPRLELYGPDGSLIVADEDSGDGINARIVHDVTVAGTYTVVVRSANLVRGDYVLSIDGIADATPAFEVTSVSIPDGARLDAAPTELVVEFSTPVRHDTVDASDLTIDGVAAISATVVGDRTVVYQLPAIGTGTFDLELAGGSILDFGGRSIAGLTSELTVAAQPIRPLGALVYSHHTSGSVTADRPEQPFASELDGGAIVSIEVVPYTMLKAIVEVRDGSGSMLATATATGPGESVVINDLDTGGGERLVVTVKGADGTVGSFGVSMLINANKETEHADGVDNDLYTDAQLINTAFVDLGTDASRAAVFGSLEGGKSVTIDSDDFESGALGGQWTTVNAGSGPGVIEVTGNYTSSSGAYAMIHRGTNNNAGPANLESIWTVDLTGVDSPYLGFSYRVGGDKQLYPLGGEYSGSVAADGVSMSVDGVNWVPVYSLQENGGGWHSEGINLAIAAADAGLDIDGQVQIKFQSTRSLTSVFVNGETFDRTVGFDDIRVYRSLARDTYGFDVVAGDTVSVGVVAPDGEPVSIELLDPSGSVLATSSSDRQEFDGIIHDFRVFSTGRYYISVVGADGADYVAHVAKNLSYTLTPDGTALPPATDITATGAAIGAAGYDMGRLFIFNDDGNFNSDTQTYDGYFIIELDPVTGEELNRFQTPLNTGGGGGFATTPTTLIFGNRELDPDTGQVIREMPFDAGSGAYHNGEVFVGGSSVKVYDYASGLLKRTIPGALGALAATPRGIVGIDGADVYLIDPVTNERRLLGDILPSDNYYVGSAVVGERLYVSEFNSNRISVYDLGTLSLVDQFTVRVEGYSVSLSDLAGDAGFGAREYTFNANAGDIVTIRTATPGGDDDQFENDLDPVVELYRPDGTLIAIADNNTSDMRNARLIRPLLETGTYTIKVFGAAGGGEFVLTVDGHTGVSNPPFVVAETSPNDGEHLLDAPDTIVVRFSHAFDQTTLSASDLEIDGTPAVGLSILDGLTAEFTVSGALSEGSHELTFDATSVRGINGQELQAFTSTFEVDQTPATVVAATARTGADLLYGEVYIDVEFDDPIDPLGLDEEDYELVDGSGGVHRSSGFSYDEDTRVFSARYEGLAPGQYTFRLISGENSFRDTLGFDLDGEPIGTPSGDGIEGGDFTLDFDAEFTDVAFGPLNGGAFGGSRTGLRVVDASVVDPSGTTVYTLALAAGENLAIGLTADAGLRLTAELRDPGGVVVWQQDAAAVGDPLRLQGLRAPVDGDYTLTVGSLDSTTGAYSILAMTNGTFDADLRFEDTNGTQATAQALDGQFTPNGAGSSHIVVRGATRVDTGPNDWDREDDWYRFTANAGDVLTLGMDIRSTDPNSQRLQLIDAQGQVLAEGAYNSNPTFRTVSGPYVAPTTGEYFARVSGDDLPYDLVVGINTTFEYDTTNDPQWPEQVLLVGTSSIGQLSYANEYDDYIIEAVAGTKYTVSTQTPAAGATAGESTADLEIELINPSDESLGTYASGDPDGKNVAFTFLATETGSYTVRVRRETPPANGLVAEYFQFDASVDSFPNFDALDPFITIVEPRLQHGNGDFLLVDQSDYGARWTGTLYVPEAGLSLFEGTGFARYRFFVDDQLVLRNDTDVISSDRRGYIELSEGYHEVRLEYAQQTGDAMVNVRWTTGSAIYLGSIPEDRFFVQRPAVRDYVVTLEQFAPPAPIGGLLTPIALTATGGGTGLVISSLESIEPSDESIDTADGAEQALTAASIAADGFLYAVTGHADPIVTVDEYTIDLSGRVGKRIDVVLDGIDDAYLVGARFDLIGPDGVSVLASSSADPLGSGGADFEQGILGFVVPEAGVYTVRMTGVGARGD